MEIKRLKIIVSLLFAVVLLANVAVPSFAYTEGFTDTSSAQNIVQSETTEENMLLLTDMADNDVSEAVVDSSVKSSVDKTPVTGNSRSVILVVLIGVYIVLSITLVTYTIRRKSKSEQHVEK